MISPNLYALSMSSVVFLSLVHVLADFLGLEGRLPRRYWLSLADGISISYVFLGLLPKILDGISYFPDASGGVVAVIRDNPFLPLLIGLVAFYSLERMVEQPRLAGGHQAADADSTRLRAWIHLASYALYKAIIGYFIVQISSSAGLALFVVSMTVHFLVVDYRMMEIHKSVYQRFGRWVLSLAILVGWVIGITTSISPTLLTLLLGFLAGGIVLVVLEEEFSRQHPSSLLAFLSAVIVYSLIQILI